MYKLVFNGCKAAICAMACLAMTLPISCQQAPQLPAPVSVQEVYQDYSRDKEENPTRLKSRVDSGEISAFSGYIWKIDGKSLQFLIKEGKVEELLSEEGASARDAYVQCEFPEETSVVRFNLGQRVTVYGNLDEAFDEGMFRVTGDGRAIKFKDCALYPSDS